MSNKNKTNKSASNDATLPAGQPVNSGEANAAPKAPGKKRGRTSLSEADKAHMQACRKLAAEAKERLALVLSDKGITNAEVWKGLPSSQFDLIAGVVKATKALKANAMIAEAKAQYEAACKGKGVEPDATLMAAVPAVAEPKRHKYTEAEKTALAKARNQTDNGLTLGLLDEHISDYRIWMGLPIETLDAIAGVTEAQAPVMNDKRVIESKNLLASLLSDAGQKPANP